MESECVTRIDGWVTPRMERVLERAAAISAERGFNYLGVEHVALAIMEDPASVPAECWTGAMTTQQWRSAVLATLPDGSANPHNPPTPVRVTTTRRV